MRFLPVFLILAATATVESTFLAALGAGWVPFSGVLALVVARMTMEDRRGIYGWLMAGMLAAELYAPAPSGVAAASVVAAAATVRILLFTVFTHHSLPARIAAAFAGVTAGLGVSRVLRATAAMLAGGRIDTLSATIPQTLISLSVTACGACLLMLLFSPTRRRDGTVGHAGAS